MTIYDEISFLMRLWQMVMFGNKTDKTLKKKEELVHSRISKIKPVVSD